MDQFKITALADVEVTALVYGSVPKSLIDPHAATTRIPSVSQTRTMFTLTQGATRDGIALVESVSTGDTHWPSDSISHPQEPGSHLTVGNLLRIERVA